MKFRDHKSIRRPHKKRSTLASTQNDYAPLEPRQLLAVDLGFAVTSTTFDPTANLLAPNSNGDIGPNHIVEVVSGTIAIRDVVGNEISSTSLQSFFDDVAGADISIGQDINNNDIDGQVVDARVIFDHDTDRWFVSASVADEDGSNLFGNDVLLAVSRTDNPVDGFQSVQFVGDTTGDHFNSDANLAVDGTGVFITTFNEIDVLNTSVSVYAIPKADLVGTIPSALNLARFENLDETVFGNSIQFATDLDADATSSLGLATFENGTTLSQIEISNLGTGNPVTISQSDITVPFYQAADDGRQIGDVTRLNNISPEITGNVVSQGGFLWTVHAVDGSADNSALRWYQIDEATGVVVNTGDIEDPDVDYLYPSIAVNQFGGVAIGFSGTGLTQTPSAFLSLGFSSIGLDATPTVVFPDAPSITQVGADNIVNVVDGINPFGEYSATRVDPDDPFSFFSFQEFVAADDVWGVSIGEASITDISPAINASAANNEVILRRSAVNSSLIEISIDGNVTDVYEIAAINRLELNLLGGDDTIIIDETFGAIQTDFGFTINGGEGNDVIRVIDSGSHRFDIIGDQTGLLDFVNTFSGIEELEGSDGDDIFTAVNSPSDWIIRGGDGNDLFDIGNSVTGNYQLFGQTGDDSYRLPLANFATIEVIDSVDDENDALIGIGTDGNDVTLINNDLLVFNGDDVSIFGFDGIEQLDFDGLAGDDTFNLQAFDASINIFGSAGNDVFNLSSNAGLNTGTTAGILGEVNIFGGDGVNRLAISNLFGVPSDVTVTTDQIVGLTPEPVSFTGNFGNTGETPGIELTGSDFGVDNFIVSGLLADNSLLVQGGAGDDTFTIRSTTEGPVYLDGNEGGDTFRTSVAGTERSVTVIDSGADDSRDRFSIRLTNAFDVATIGDEQLIQGLEEFAWDASLENLIVSTLGGNDDVTITENETDAIRVILGDGDDRGTVNGSLGISSIRFDGDDGQDSFDFLNSVADTFAQALGGDGNDTFFVSETSFARGRVDGQGGNDDVEVIFASRDGRRINARDTGGGDDELVINGTPTADRLDFRSRIIDREGEFVSYDENTEQLFLNLIGSNDIVNFFSSSVSEVSIDLGIGNDVVNINSTSTNQPALGLDFILGAGADTFNVFRVSAVTTINALGQSGDDRFNVGSTTLTNDGNLSRIRGNVFLSGGADFPGMDSLQVNDAASGDLPFNYNVSDSSISNAAGLFGRPFGELNYEGLEFVVLSGNDGRNRFNVMPSLDTIIRVDGNANPTPDAFFGDSLNLLGNISTQGRELFTNGSDGFFTFADGSRNVSFLDLELLPPVDAPQPGAFLLPPGSNGDDLFNVDPDRFIADILLEEMDS